MNPSNVYFWLENNKGKLKSIPSFKEAALTIALETANNSHPSENEVSNIISIMKEYEKANSKKCKSCKGTRGVFTFIGVKYFEPAKFIPCEICKGTGTK